MSYEGGSALSTCGFLKGDIRVVNTETCLAWRRLVLWILTRRVAKRGNSLVSKQEFRPPHRAHAGQTFPLYHGRQGSRSAVVAILATANMLGRAWASKGLPRN